MDALRFGLAAALVLVAPGALLAASVGIHRRLTMAEGLGWCLGASPALWALAFLWSQPLGVSWNRQVCVVVVAAAAGLLPWRMARADPGASRRRRGACGQAKATTVLALFIVLVAGILRFRDARGLVATPWVDGFHHTVIVQLFLDQGGLPHDYRPYVAADRFDYHFGFHAVCAAVSWIADVEPRRSVLWMGQLLASLAPLSMLLLARLLGLGQFGALIAAILPAVWLWFPAYFLSWGRYTQLCGLLLLTTLLWTLRWALAGSLTVRGRLRLPRFMTAAVLAGGLVLTHYRVTVFFGLAAGLLAFPLRGMRRRLGRLAIIGALALVVVSPWLRHGLGPALVGFMGMAAPAGGTEAAVTVQAAPAWILTQHHGGFWLRLAALGLLWAVLFGRRGAWALLVWSAGALILTRADFWGPARSWALPEFAVAISWWLVIAVGCGWLAELATDLLQRWDATAAWAVVLLTSFLVVAWLGRGADWNAQAEGVVAMVAAAAGLALLGRRPPPIAGGSHPRVRWRFGFALTLLLIGAAQMPGVLNETTVLLRPVELAAADWIRANTPPDARFYINQTAWNQGAYRGVDGGYWLPLTAGRSASLPPAVYALHDAVTVRAAQARAARLTASEPMTDREIEDLLDGAAANWVYVGPGSAALERGMLQADRFDRMAGLRLRYRRDGVSVYQRIDGASIQQVTGGCSVAATAMRRIVRGCARCDLARHPSKVAGGVLY